MPVEPQYDPPPIDCCQSAIATGGAYHSERCHNHPAHKELQRTGMRRKGRISGKGNAGYRKGNST